METTGNIVLKLNQMLETDKFRRKEFDILIQLIKDEYKAKVIFLNFKYYSDYRRRIARKEKIKNLKCQDFEAAAFCRSLELECTKYISLKKEYGIIKSAFTFDQSYLYYLCLGTSRNDHIVKRLLKSP